MMPKIEIANDTAVAMMNKRLPVPYFRSSHLPTKSATTMGAITQPDMRPKTMSGSRQIDFFVSGGI